jgi:hypothetical protein
MAVLCNLLQLMVGRALPDGGAAQLVMLGATTVLLDFIM